MVMRDGMPGPGWWIASDGRWYPPELHPDMRAATAVVVEDPTPPASLTTESSPTTLDVFPDLSYPDSANGQPANGRAGNGAVPDSTVPVLTALRSSSGTRVPTRDREATTTTAPAPPRSARQRLAFGTGLAVATLLVIIYFARGHDVRPSLDTSAGTTPPTTVAQSAPTTVAPTTAPQRASVTVAPATAAAPSTTPVASLTTTTRAGTTPATSTVTSAARITPRLVSVFDLVKGNCVDGASLSDGLVTTIRVVDCSEVHTHEVYYSGRYPESTFDANRISGYANDTCLAQFATYVGIDYTRSRYQYLHIVPTQESWTRDNDRDVVCVAFEEDATITGTIAGRAQ